MSTCKTILSFRCRQKQIETILTVNVAPVASFSMSPGIYDETFIFNPTLMMYNFQLSPQRKR